MIAIFPGQGAQYVGMGKELFENFAIARETFEEASDASKLKLKRLCFDGPESDLTLTENLQPSLLTVSVAAFRVFATETGFKPKAVAGHSLGEYSALVANGALPLGAAAAWVRERGAAMQRAVPAGQGTMAALLGMEDALVEELCKEATRQTSANRSNLEIEYDVAAVVEPANFNAPGQVVIAGSVDAVSTAIKLIQDGTFKGKAMQLNVSAPFHSSLMRPARDRMAELFAAAGSEVRPTQMSCAYVPNRTARLTQEAGVVLELLVDQVDHPVLWKQSVVTLLDAGHAKAIEFGPGKVLQGLCKRIQSHAGTTLAVTPCGDLAGIKAAEGVLL
jgi:[acyl-carrier-protein] S-malonyltransferase